MAKKQRKPRWSKQLRAMLGREEELWLQVDVLIHEGKASAYDQAVALLVDLQKLSILQDTQATFDEWLEELIDDFRRRHALLRKLRSAGLMPDKVDEPSTSPPKAPQVPEAPKVPELPTHTIQRKPKTIQRDKSKSKSAQVARADVPPSEVREGEATLAQWRDLYKAALWFRDAAPWEWLFENDHIAMRHPHCPKDCFLSIMGALGEFFSLTAYLGGDAFSLFLQVESLLQEDERNSDIFMLLEIPALVASFESFDQQSPRDLELLQALGLGPKELGDEAMWPLFRFRRPGLEPWYLNAGQVLQLTWCLEQGMDVAMRMLRHPALRAPWREEQTVLFREARLTPEMGWSWQDVWETFVASPQPYPVKIDRQALASWRHSTIHRHIAVEVDLFPMPVSVLSPSGGPSLQPYIWLIADCSSQMILAQGMVGLEDENDSWDRHIGQIPAEIFASFHELLEGMPGLIYVSSNRLASLLAPITDMLGNELRVVDRLPISEDLKTNMYEHFQKSQELFLN